MNPSEQPPSLTDAERETLENELSEIVEKSEKRELSRKERARYYQLHGLLGYLPMEAARYYARIGGMPSM